MTRLPSNSIPENDLGLAPVAIMILSASIVSIFCLFFTSRDVLEVSFPVPVIWKSDLQQHIRGGIPSDKDILKKIGTEVEELLIEESLIATDGVKSEAAKLLGWGRNTLARKAKKIN